MKKIYVAPEMELTQNVADDVLNSASTAGTFIEDTWDESEIIL